MIKRTVLPIIIFVLLTFAGCSSQNDDGITRTEAAHTFDGYPVVYIVPDVSPEGFLAAYRALEVPDTENVAVKLSDTEKDNGFLWTELVSELSQSLEEPVIAENHSAVDFSDFDYLIVASHFRSHRKVGFNGAVKQTAMIPVFTEKMANASDRQHQLEALAEAGKRSIESLSGHILYINVMDRLSIESGGYSLPDSNTYNIGILSSYDPVALDQACVDFVYMVREGAPFAAHIAAQHGIYTLDYAEKIGLGSRTYALSMIDDPFSAAALLSANQKAKSKI